LGVFQQNQQATVLRDVCLIKLQISDLDTCRIQAY
jgi:hypothetical protein